MMVALPLAFNLTTPLEETAATLVLELLQVILSVEFPGVNLPFTVKRYPLYAVMLFRFSRIRFAGISLTVTVQDAFFPLERVAVITAFPFLFAVTFPVLLTTATLVLELLHFGVSLALAGVVVAFRTAFFPFRRLKCFSVQANGFRCNNQLAFYCYIHRSGQSGATDSDHCLSFRYSRNISFTVHLCHRRIAAGLM